MEVGLEFELCDPIGHLLAILVHRLFLDSIAFHGLLLDRRHVGHAYLESIKMALGSLNLTESLHILHLILAVCLLVYFILNLIIQGIDPIMALTTLIIRLTHAGYHLVRKLLLFGAIDKTCVDTFLL